MELRLKFVPTIFTPDHNSHTGV